ncbi:trichohyalin-like isoform X2 [Syngnathoides biaculeatus]|uniref:trichohyalin-like isoform X2 n=1 Tax=Syngnathoides biaculeatus TaxID=300417 RepID=UPI002ADDD6D2|nr:trichohyalin-like isoform X2 [Syngnathoides biaculeatus]
MYTLSIAMSGSENHEDESDCSEEEIRVYARDIGIEPESEPELLWLAREAIFARLPPGWAESQDESGNPIFHNHYLQTSTIEHPCKVQYRQLVAQERERFQRTAAVGGSVSQIDKKENEQALSTPTGLFCSGFLSVIGSRCEETSSLTLLSLDDEEEGIISGKEDSKGTASGDQAEEMTKSEMQDKAHSGDKSSESPMQEMSGEFPISDNSISCDSQLEMDEKGEDEETSAAKGPDKLGHESSGEGNHSGAVDRKREHVPCSDAVGDAEAEQDQEKEEQIKAPGGFFCSGFLSVLGSGQDESSTPSSHDEDNVIIFEKKDSRSSDTDLIEEPQMHEENNFADHNTDSSEQQIIDEPLDSSVGSDSQLDIEVKDEDGETEVVKSPDESGEKPHFCPKTHDFEYIQMPSSSSSIGALVAEKDKQVEKANNKTLGLSENSIHSDCQLGIDVKDQDNKVPEDAKRQDVPRTQVDQGHKHIQSVDAVYHSEAKQSPQKQEIRDCGADPSKELDETHPDYSIESQQAPSDLLQSDRSVNCDSHLERDVKEGVEEENVISKSKDVHSVLIDKKHKPIHCTGSDSEGEHDQEKEKLIKTPGDKRGNNAELPEEMTNSEITESDGQCIESTDQQLSSEFHESGSCVCCDSQLASDVKEGENEAVKSQDESGHNFPGRDSHCSQLDSKAKQCRKQEESITNMGELAECLGYDSSFYCETQQATKENKTTKSQDDSRRTHTHPGKDSHRCQVDHNHEHIQCIDEQKPKEEGEPLKKVGFPGQLLESSNSVSSDSHLEMDMKEGEDEETEASKSRQDESGHYSSCKQVHSKSVTQEYRYIQGIDDSEALEADREKEDEEEATETDSRDSNEETREITESETYEKSLSEDQKNESRKHRAFSCHCQLSRDNKEEVDKGTEAAKSQLGEKSFREDVQNHKLTGHTDNVERSGAKQDKEEEDLIILSSEISEELLASSDSSFVEKNFEGNEGDEETQATNETGAVGNSGTKPEDQSSKTPSDSAVAIRDGDLAEEITELEAQSEDQSPESPQEEVSERVLDSSDSLFETSSKSQDESGNDLSVEDVYSDIVAQECEHIQCDNTVGRSEAKHKEEKQDDFSRTGSHLEDQKHEIILSSKSLGVSNVEQDKGKEKFSIKPGLLTDSTDSDDSVSYTDSQSGTDQDTKSQDESGYDAVGASGDEQDQEEEDPHKTLEVTKKLLLREERMCRHQGKVRQDEEEEEGFRRVKEALKSQEKNQKGRLLSEWKHGRKEEEEAELPREKQKRIILFEEKLKTAEEETAGCLMRDKEKRMLLYEGKLRRQEDADANKLISEKDKRIQFCQEALRNKEEELKLSEREMEDRLKREKELRILSCQEEEMRENDGRAKKLNREKEVRMRHNRDQLSKEEEKESEQLRYEKEIRIWQQREIRREEEEEALQLMRDKETRIQLHQKTLRKKEEEEIALLEIDMKTRINVHKDKLSTDFDRLKSEKDLVTCFCPEKLMKKDNEEAEELKRIKEIEMQRNEQQIQISQQKEELMNEEKAEVARLKREKVARICQYKVELKQEEEEEAEQLKREKEMRLQLCREELRKREKEEVEWLKSEMDTRKCAILEELHRAQREAEQSMRERQMRMEFCLEKLRKEEEEEAAQLKREKAIRMCQHKKELMKAEEKEIAQLKKDTERRICHYLEELMREEKEEVEQLKQEKEMRLQLQLEQLQREEEVEAEIFQREKDVRLHLYLKQQMREREEEEKEIKKYIDTRKFLLQEELRREEDEAEEMKRGRAMRTYSHQKEQLQSNEEEEEQLERERRTQLNHGKLRNEEEENLMNEEDSGNSLSLDELSRKAPEVAWLRRGKEMRLRLYQEGLRREETDEIESLMRELMTRMCLHQEVLRRAEEKEVEQLQKERQTKMRVCQEELRRQNVKDLDKLRREKANKTHHLLKELQEEEKEQVKRYDAMKINFQEFSSEETEAERLQEEMQFHLEELMREEDKAEELNRCKTDCSTDEDGEEQFMREFLTKTILHEKELPDEGEEVGCLKREMMRILFRQEGQRRGDDEPEKLEPRKTSAWLCQEHNKEEEIKGMLQREIETQKMLNESEMRDEDEEAWCLKNGIVSISLRQVGRTNEEEEPLKMDKIKCVPQKELMREQKEKEGLKEEKEDKSNSNQEGSRREYEIEGLKKERETIVNLNQEVMKIPEEQEKKRPYNFQKELKTNEEEEAEIIKREKEKMVYYQQEKLRNKEMKEMKQLNRNTGELNKAKLDETQLFTKDYPFSLGGRRNGSPNVQDHTCVQLDELQREGQEQQDHLKMEMVKNAQIRQKNPRSIDKVVKGLTRENETHLHCDLRREMDEEEEEVDFLKREKWRRICLYIEDLKREEEEEVEQLQREKETRIRIYEEELRRDEEIEADNLKREKEQRIRLLQLELRVEEEEEAEQLKRDKEKRMSVLYEKLKKEEDDERLKWENERRTLLHQEEQCKHEEEEQFKRIGEKRRSLYLEELRKEEKDTAERFKREKELRTHLHQEELWREEQAEVEQLRKEKDKTIHNLQVDLMREEEEELIRVKEKRTHLLPEMLKIEEEDVQQLKREKEKRMEYCQEELKKEEDKEAEQLKIEKEKRMSHLQDELRRETEELIDKLKAEKQKRMRLRQIDMWREEEERKLKTEYKERLRVLRQSLLAKRRKEETLLNNMFEQKEKLTESVKMEREDEQQFKLRQDREAALRALCLALEEEREAERGRLTAQRRQFFECFKAKSEEEPHTLKTRLQEDLKSLTSEALEKTLDSGFCGTFYPLNGAALESQHEIFGAFRPPPQRFNTTHFSAFNPILGASHSMTATPAYTTMHPSLSTPEPVFCHPRATVTVDPFTTTSLRETYLANTPPGYCDQLSLNKFNEITVYRFQRQNKQCIPSAHM